MMRIFVCDGDGKAALGITRSLGQKGMNVTVGSHLPIGRALLSKYCSKRVRYPDPHDEQACIEFFLDYLRKNPVDVLIPVSYITCRFFSKNKGRFEGLTRIPIADWSSMCRASCKRTSMLVADQCGVPRPNTTPWEMKFPYVIKSDGESSFFRYVNTPVDAMVEMTGKTAYEYIPGNGYGYVGLFNHGKLVIDFQHMRLREYPITGGASTFAKAVYYDELKQSGQKIFESLNWHGVGMCEFKRDSRDGKFKLIEINPKFWGSLDLSLVWGIDFPYYLVQMAMGTLPDKIPVQQNEAKLFRWIFPNDVLCLLADPSILPVWIDDLFIHRICRFSYDRSDWLPELFNITMTPYAIVQALRAGLRYPNGRPIRMEDM